MLKKCLLTLSLVALVCLGSLPRARAYSGCEVEPWDGPRGRGIILVGDCVPTETLRLPEGFDVIYLAGAEVQGRVDGPVVDLDKDGVLLIGGRVVVDMTGSPSYTREPVGVLVNGASVRIEQVTVTTYRDSASPGNAIAILGKGTIGTLHEIELTDVWIDGFGKRRIITRGEFSIIEHGFNYFTD